MMLRKFLGAGWGNERRKDMQDQISIEVKDCNWNKDVFSLSSGGEDSSITFYKDNMKKIKKIKTVKISDDEFNKILDTIENLDYSLIYKEQPCGLGFDGWSLICTVRTGLTTLSIEVWCPEKKENNSETNKMIEICEYVFSLMNYKIDPFCP